MAFDSDSWSPWTGGTDAIEEKATILARVTAELTRGDLERGRQLLREQYPFDPIAKTSRSYTERQCLRVFYRDGFIDRYAGTQLVHPGVLRLLSVLLPDDFPAHPNWSMAHTHFAFWELFPSIDHLVPVARGGVDDETNWVTTSMLRNSAKAHWTLEEIDWHLVPAGDHRDWDGLTAWFTDYLQRRPDLQRDKCLARWLRATIDVRHTIR